MNIYLVKRTGNVQYDEYRGHVVIAKSKRDAIKILPSNEDPFFFKRKVDITFLGIAAARAKRGSILADYNAG